MKYIKKEPKVSRTAGKSKGKYLQNLLLKLSLKATEKAWLFYEFSFSLNPGDQPIDAQARKKYSSLYPKSTEDQFQANSKKY